MKNRRRLFRANAEYKGALCSMWRLAVRSSAVVSHVKPAPAQRLKSGDWAELMTKIVARRANERCCSSHVAWRCACLGASLRLCFTRRNARPASAKLQLRGRANWPASIRPSTSDRPFATQRISQEHSQCKVELSPYRITSLTVHRLLRTALRGQSQQH